MKLTPPAEAHVSLFTGLGGWEYALQLADIPHRTVLYCEINTYRQEVIRQRIRDGIFHDAPIWPDVRTLDGRPFAGRVGILTASFPCQPHSVAGKREGGFSEKDLWPECYRVICEIRPALVLLENPEGAKRYFFHRIIPDLQAMGFYTPPPDIVSAAEVGAGHLRRRILLAAHIDGGHGDKGGRIPSWQGRHTIKCPLPNCWPFSDDDYKTQPYLGGDVHGLPYRRQRLEALGDGLVPAVAAEFLRRVMCRQ